MNSWLVPAVLAAFGLAALGFGTFMWRSADSIVEDARRTLHGMFGEGFPGLFTSDPDPRAARIAGVGVVGLGVALLAVAAILLLVQ